MTMKALLLLIFNAPNRLICRILDHRWVYNQFQYQATTRECRRCLAVHTPEDDPIFQEMVDDVVEAEEEHPDIHAMPIDPDTDPVIRIARALKQQREIDYLEDQFRLLVATMSSDERQHQMETKGSCPFPDLSPWELRDRIAVFSEDEAPEVVEWSDGRVRFINLQIATAERLLRETT